MTIKLHRTKRVVPFWKVHRPCLTCWSDHEHGILLKQLHWQSVVHMIFSCISNSSISVHMIITKKKKWKWKKNLSAHYSLVKKKIHFRLQDRHASVFLYLHHFLCSNSSNNSLHRTDVTPGIVRQLCQQTLINIIHLNDTKEHNATRKKTMNELIDIIIKLHANPV